MYRFEICANSVASCLAAQEGGAHRVELCAGIPEGAVAMGSEDDPYGTVRTTARRVAATIASF